MVVVKTHFHSCMDSFSLGNMFLGSDAGEKIDGKTQNVASEDEGDCPLENCGGIAVMCCRAGYESDREDDFKEDEGEFDPERCSEHSVVAVVNS